jgi:hypothetical protein
MQADRRYSLPEGTAHAAYDGSAWYVTAHPANGSGQRDALSVTTYRDEGSFRGRQWLVEGPGGAAIPDGDNDMGAGYASLRSVAETAIREAYSRVHLAAIVAEANEDDPYGNGTLAVTCGGCGFSRLVLDDETPEQARAAHEGTDIHRNWEREVEALMRDGYTAGEAEAIVAHGAGDHDEESDTGCPRCADTHDEEDTVETIDLTPGNAEQQNILTMLSEAFAQQGMLPNAYGAMASVLDLARCLQANDPQRLEAVIAHLRNADAQWGPDTPAGRAAKARRDAEERAYTGADEDDDF